MGGELCRQIGHSAIPFDIDTLDLTDSQAVMDTLLPMNPGLIINCAAYTQVDKAEKEPELAHAVNVTAVENMVRACRELDCPLVQISTDYVFSGVINPRPSVAPVNHPYREDDPPSPQGVYARTKLDGERAAAQHKKNIIVRTCGLYARPDDHRAHNFVKTMLRLGGTQSEIRVVADQHCTPSYVPHVARAILFLAGIDSTGPAPWGIYNVTNTGATTWFDFAAEIFKQAGMNISLKAITTAEYAAPAARPSYSVLDTAKYHNLGGPPMPDWKTGLKDYFEVWRKIKTSM